MHPRKHVLDRLREKLVGRLQHLERIHVSSAITLHHELCLNFPGNA